jgi:hypothetical protein
VLATTGINLHRHTIASEYAKESNTMMSARMGSNRRFATLL